MVIYYLQLPQSSFPIPPPLPPMEGSSLLMQEADASHQAANFGGLAGVATLTWWHGGMLTYRYSVVNSKFTLSLRRPASPHGDRETQRERCPESGYFPHVHGIIFSVMPTCTTEHV